MPDFSQLFCNFWGRILCMVRRKKIYGDDRTAETSHYRKWKAIFPLYYHKRSLASKTKSNRERTAFPIFVSITFRIFTWFHLISFILYVIYLYKHPFSGVEDLTYLTFVNTQNLHFRAKTWFFIIFERSAFI